MVDAGTTSVQAEKDQATPPDDARDIPFAAAGYARYLLVVVAIIQSSVRIGSAVWSQ